MTVLAFAGLRLGEAPALRWRDVHFDADRVVIGFPVRGQSRSARQESSQAVTDPLGHCTSRDPRYVHGTCLPAKGPVTAPHPLSVLLVDDHDLFRTGMRGLLEEEGFEVADAANGEAALRRLPAMQPDVVVMDVNMPGMSGIEATREIARRSPSTAVMMLTVAQDDARVLDAVMAGASGYLLKDASLEDIVAGIHAAAAGETVLASRVAGGLLERIRAGEEPEEAAAPACDLSEREREILALVAAGLDNREIGQRLFIGQSTVKTHVSNILVKLGVENRVQAAVYAIRNGLADSSAN